MTPIWAAPGYRWWALGVMVVLAIAFALDYTRRRRLLEKVGHAPQLQRMAASVSPARRGLKAVLLVLGLALVTLSLSRPQIEGQSEWRQRGIDVAIVLDYSKSMLARDVYPSRSERVKLEAEALMDAFSGDRVAVVAFAGGAIHYPLTTDYEAAKILFRGLSPLDMAPGSDIGEAILTARCMLRRDVKDDPDCARVGGRRGPPSDEDDDDPEDEGGRTEHRELEDRARAMVIFTDGEDTEGRAQDEIRRAAELGIQVYVVGVGTKEGDQIPEYDRNGNEVGWKRSPDGKGYFRTRLDEQALKELARAAGGEDHYFRDDPRRIGVENLVKGLGRLKEGNLEARVVRKYKEAYQWLLFPAFMVLLVEACISDRRRRRA
jgi:Ca-activated chloride channel homolog